jgi:hypothetical protein
MAEYMVLSDVHIDPTGCARAWMYNGIAMKLAHSVSAVQLLSLDGYFSPIVQIGLRERSAIDHRSFRSLMRRSRSRRCKIPARTT